MKKLEFEKVGKQQHPKTITDLSKSELKCMKHELKSAVPDTKKLRWYSVPISIFSKKDLERIIVIVTEHLRKEPSYEGAIYVLRRLGLQGTEIPLKKISDEDKEIQEEIKILKGGVK